MHLALYQPDIPQNTGTLIRLGACLGVAVEVIEPCGFLFDDRRFRRGVMDYADSALVTRHTGWTAFRNWQTGVGRRLVLVETGDSIAYTDFSFRPDDVLLLGRESAGTPTEVAAACDARVHIPMRPGFRSLNQAVAAAMVVGEALRQTGGFAGLA